MTVLLLSVIYAMCCHLANE